MTAIERAKADEMRLRREINRLEVQLQSARQQHLKVLAYIELADFYDSGDGASPDLSRPRGGVSGAAVRAAIAAIQERRSPIHTRDLIEILEKQGIQIGGNNPVANLSGFLSRSDELRNNRAEGWGLADWENVAEEPAGSAQVRTKTDASIIPRGEPIQRSEAAEPPSWDTTTGAMDLDDEIPF